MKYIINIIRKTLPVMTAIVAAAAMLAGCTHKDLYRYEPEAQLINVHFNWENLEPGDSRPEGMTLYFYNQFTGDASRYDIPTKGNEDDTIEVLSGPYDIIVYDTEAHGITNQNIGKLDDHTIVCTEPNKPVPPMYGNIYDLEITQKEGTDSTLQVITITPKRIHKLYKVTATNTDAIAEAVVWSATLSGLTNSIYAKTGKCAEDAHEAVIEFPLYKVEGTTAVSHTFRTFGRLDNSANRSTVNKLLVSVVKKDNSVLFYKFDVTDQVVNAADPYNVPIVVDFKNMSPLQPTDPDYPGKPDDDKKDQNMNAGVDDFTDEFIDIDMRQ